MSLYLRHESLVNKDMPTQYLEYLWVFLILAQYGLAQGQLYIYISHYLIASVETL